MIDPIDALMKDADPARRVPGSVDARAREVMRSATRTRRRPSRLRITVLSTLGLLLIGGGVAVAAPAIHNVFYPEVTLSDVTLTSTGSSTWQCTSTLETSIKIGDVKKHQATVQRWRAFAAQHHKPVHVPAGADRFQVNRAVATTYFTLIADFDRADPGESLEEAADIYNSGHCIKTTE